MSLSGSTPGASAAKLLQPIKPAEIDEDNYENNVEYNNWLDDNYPLRIESATQGSIPISASKSLFHTDRDAYILLSSDWDEARKRMSEEYLDELKNNVTTHYPRTIAWHFYRLDKLVTNHNEALSVLKDIWESLIYFLYGFLIADYVSKGYKFPSLPNKDKPGTFDKPDFFGATLHNRLRIIRALINHAQTAKQPLIFSNISSSAFDTTFIDRLIELNHTRNRFSHDETLSEDAAKNVFDERYPILLDIIATLDRLGDVKVFRPIEFNIATDTLRAELFNSRDFMRGIENIRFTSDQINDYKHLLGQNNRLLAMLDGTVICLAPFIHYKNFGQPYNQICYFKQTGNGGMLLYGMLAAGEEDIAKTEFAAEINEMDKLKP